MKTVEERVIAVIKEELFLVPPATLDLIDNLEEDLEADSLDRVLIADALEEVLNIEITDEEWEKVVTVGDAVELAKRISY